MINKELMQQELVYKAVRSGGKGGQNVNKVATCVQLFFNIKSSMAIDETAKNRIIKKLENRINSEGVIVLDCSETRSQLKNKEIVLKKFLKLIDAALVEQKKRIKTKTPTAVKLKRLSDKKFRGEIKSGRNFRHHA